MDGDKITIVCTRTQRLSELTGEVAQAEVALEQARQKLGAYIAGVMDSQQPPVVGVWTAITVKDGAAEICIEGASCRW